MIIARDDGRELEQALKAVLLFEDEITDLRDLVNAPYPAYAGDLVTWLRTR